MEARRVRGALRGAHRGPAGGPGAGVLRRLHTHGGGEHAGPAGRHRQDPDPGRTDPDAGRDGSGHVMSDIHALVGAYAVDALDDVERAAFERHLAECPACRAEVAGLREAAAVIGGSVPQDPPPGLRDRVLADIATVRPLPPRGRAPAAHRTARPDRFRPRRAGRRGRRGDRARRRRRRRRRALGRRHQPAPSSPPPSGSAPPTTPRPTRQTLDDGAEATVDPLEVAQPGRAGHRRHARRARGQGLRAVARPRRRRDGRRPALMDGGEQRGRPRGRPGHRRRLRHHRRARRRLRRARRCPP